MSKVEYASPYAYWHREIELTKNKLLDTITWDEQQIKNGFKKWYIKQKELEIDIYYTLFKYPLNTNDDLITAFNIVVGWRNQYLFNMYEYIKGKDLKFYFDKAEYRFYSQIIPFIEYNLLKFVTKHRNLKLGVASYFEKSRTDQTMPALFTDKNQFQIIIYKLLENEYISEAESGKGYIWHSKEIIKNHKVLTGEGLQLVAFYIKIKRHLIKPCSARKFSEAISSYFNYTITSKNFQKSRLPEAEKHLTLFRFLD